MRASSLIQIVILLVLFLGLAVIGIFNGPSEIGFAELSEALFKGGEHSGVIMNLRLPRILMAFLAGGILTLSGFFMQALVRNPLADPYILGISAGAGFGVNLFFLGLVPLNLALGWMGYLQPLFAFIGALVSILWVMLYGFRAIRNDNSLVLIAGVAISSLFMALNALLFFLFADSAIEWRQIVFWTFGSMNKTFQWPKVIITAVLLLIGLGFGFFSGNKLDLLALGDEQASSLGMNVRRMKLALMVITALIVGGSIAFTGPVGFVGMMIPHFSRAFNGASHRKNFFPAVLLGGVFLLACDQLGITIHHWAGLPIGIITAFLGVPFFLYILFKSKRIYT